MEQDIIFLKTCSKPVFEIKSCCTFAAFSNKLAHLINYDYESHFHHD